MTKAAGWSRRALRRVVTGRTTIPGNTPIIYAFDSAGRRRGVWRVTGAKLTDWEDIAAGPGPKPGQNYLYIGDIGDNTGTRSELVVYRIPEPAIPGSDPGSTNRKPEATEPAEAIRLRYPSGKHDSEALLVHPQTGKIYLVTKVALDNPEVYAADVPQDLTQPTTLTRLGEIEMHTLFGGIVTGGAFSPDGRRAALCDYIQGYELVLPDGNNDFDSIWKQPLRAVDVGKRKHGEAISYRLDGKARNGDQRAFAGAIDRSCATVSLQEDAKSESSQIEFSFYVRKRGGWLVQTLALGSAQVKQIFVIPK